LARNWLRCSSSPAGQRRPGRQPEQHRLVWQHAGHRPAPGHQRACARWSSSAPRCVPPTPAPRPSSTPGRGHAPVGTPRARVCWWGRWARWCAHPYAHWAGRWGLAAVGSGWVGADDGCPAQASAKGPKAYGIMQVRHDIPGQADENQRPSRRCGAD
jgi:hypothetical protein